MSKIVKLRDLEIPQEVLVPMKTNTILDGFISDRGGLLPSTIYIVVGGAGSGKTSWSIDTIDKLQTVNPTKKFLYISGEYRLDLYFRVYFFPGTCFFTGKKAPVADSLVAANL